jgi:DNA-binding CsgD family transcriptional regulator
MDEAPAAVRGTIAVTIEPASPAERLGLFARAGGLTQRETELLRHLATGSDTRGLARRMSLSEHTVQDHLKSVFARTGTQSRRDLLARALGG